MAQTFSGEFKRSFGRGLAILLPSIVTLWILWQAFSFVYTNVAEPINRGTRLTLIAAAPYLFPRIYSDFDQVGRNNPIPATPEIRPLPNERDMDQGGGDDFSPPPTRNANANANANANGPQAESTGGLRTPRWYIVTDQDIAQAKARGRFRPNTPDELMVRELRREQFRRVWNSYWILNLSGFIIAILLIYLAGLLLGNFFGRSIYNRVERLITSVPGFKQVYPHVKQVVDLILGEKKMAFSKVVLVEYPSKDIWTVGFLTGESIRAIDQSAGGRVASIFIPTSPTPFTGFTINVLTERIRPMDMTVEEALRFVITAGVLTPEGADKLPPPGPPRTLTQEEAEAVAAKARKSIEESRAPIDPDRTGQDA
ncbi:MAG: DUF502 domain-containing protein [Phycisphaerales bacterium]|nr:DUF502 domain-containing protein [Planctomycetota bacterium]MCH8509584.1 DUF502 domain-containing protein [Phycisphaerales bacterium]